MKDKLRLIILPEPYIDLCTIGICGVRAPWASQLSNNILAPLRMAGNREKWSLTFGGPGANLLGSASYFITSSHYAAAMQDERYRAEVV